MRHAAALFSAGSPAESKAAWKHSMIDRPSSVQASAEAMMLSHWQSVAQAASGEAHTCSAQDQHALNAAFDGWNVKMSAEHAAAPPESPVAVDVEPVASFGSTPPAESRAPVPESCAPYALGLAFDDTYVYWADNATVGTIMRAPNTGGTATIIARDTNPVAIAGDALSVYWSDQAGNIMRLGK